MAQVQYIKDLYENEERSLREISRITGHSFETVQKYAQKENWNEDNLPDTEPTSDPVLGEFIPIVDGWLEADRKVPRKQRHTAWRLFCRLRDEYGFRGSYSSVKRYVRKKKYVMKVQSAGFLPLERTPGCGQVDFGEFLYYDAGGQEQKGYALTISFPHSNMGYTQAFPSQNQECLLEGMKRIFEHMGGVPPRLRFDNMTTAVAQVLRGTERSLTEGFSRFIADKVLPFYKAWYEGSQCDYLLHTPDQKHFDYRNYYDSSFTPLMEQLGYDQTPHCTRHTCISMLTEAHVDQTMIKKIVGHSGAMTLTERVYTHLDIETLVEAINKI